MSFYGNIKNTARTQFYFDRIYPNRKAMDANAAKDNIFAGRFVLVEYEKGVSQDDFPQYYMYNKILYSALTQVEVTNIKDATDTRLLFDGPVNESMVRPESIEDGTVFCVPAGHNISTSTKTIQYIKFNGSDGAFQTVSVLEYNKFLEQHNDYQAPIVFKIGSGGSATLYTDKPIQGGMYATIPPNRDYEFSGTIEFYQAKITVDEETGEASLTYDALSKDETDFTRNFNIDKSLNTGRSYDSTVWQKVYEGNQERYIMVADLNTITPTFAFTADAPTVTPVPIHYDPCNTNTHYNIHMQGPWGFRVRGANGEMTLPLINHRGRIDDLSTAINATEHVGDTYPSDFGTSWKGQFYDYFAEESSEKYFSPISGKWNGKEGNQTSSIPSAVYVNTRGFSPEIIAKSSDVREEGRYSYDATVTVNPSADYIGVTPTGYSGRVYNDHTTPEGFKPAPDTQELIIMLPSIGNAISDMWDLVYGGRETSEYINITDKRNLDINWEYANGVVEKNGLRAVMDANGHFNTPAVNTLAGCINSVHDLMGMIIVNNSDNLSPDELEEQYIYHFSDGTYRRKVTAYNYADVTYDYHEIELGEHSYAPGEYLIKNGSNYVRCDDANFNPSQTYYYKTVSTPSQYQKVILSGKPDFDLFYRTPEDNYRIVPTVTEDVTYYRYISSKTVKVTAFYEPYSFYYYKADELTYNLDTADAPTPDRRYLIVGTETIANVSLKDYALYDVEKGQYAVAFDDAGKPTEYTDLKYVYAPGFFYDLTENDGSRTLTLLEGDGTDLDYSKYYYIVEGNIKEGDGAGNWVQNPDGSFTNSDGVTNLQITGWYKVKLLPFEEYVYLYKSSVIEYDPNEDDYDFEGEEEEDKSDEELEEESNKNPYSQIYTAQYTFVTKESLKDIYKAEFTHQTATAVFKTLYTLEWKDTGIFYTPNKFYYKTNDGSWAIDKAEKMTDGRQYYESVDMRLVNGMRFYVPNKYYIVDPITNKYVIDKSLVFDASKTYYELLTALYVKSDSLNCYATYSEWPMNVTQIPASVHLMTRTPYITTEVMPEFARQLNTLHGLILKANQLFEINNFETRDTLTVQGCINKMNDIIDKFGELTPNNFLIVDNYGRVNDAHWNTLQKNSCTQVKNSTNVDILSEGVEQDRYKEAATVAAMRGQWITINLDSNPATPGFKIHHNFQKVTDTPYSTNKNTDNVASNNTYDKIDLYAPIVDAMGHVVGHNTNTVTLPYGFKTISSNGSSTAVSELTASNANVIAENTQDTFTINMGNKWLRTATNATSDTMTFAHTLSPISAQAHTKYGLVSDQTVNLLDTDNTFEVPVFQFDEAGHIIFAETHTITIPEVFESVKIVGSSTDTADTTSTDGTITADSLKDTLNFAAGNKWLQMSHDADTDTITFKHYVKKFDETTGATDLDGSQTFTVQEIAWDNAGHLTSSKKRTYTLQDGYKHMAIANSGAATVTVPTGVEGTLTAVNQVDTVSMDTGNRWIVLTADTDGKKVTISHAAPGTASNSKGDTSNQEPNFGATFKVLSAGIDQTGHVKSLAEHTVKIPLPSLTDTDTGNVVTGLSLAASTGAFTLSRANVGTLALTEYVGPNSNITSSIVATDTINGAFNKVQSYLNSLTTRIDNLDVTDTAKSGEYVSAVNQSAGVISISRVAFAPSITITGGSSTEAPKVNVTVNTKSGTAQALTIASTSVYGVTKLSNAINSDSDAIAATSKAVKTAYDKANAAVVANSAITGATKCKITYDAKGLVTGGADLTASDIPDLSATYVSKAAKFEYDLTKVATYNTTLSAITDKTLTVAQLMMKVASLEARIAELEA